MRWPRRGEVAERHRGDRALADPRRAAEQHQRAGDQPAAEDAVELTDPGLEPGDRRRLDLAQRHRAGRAPRPRRAPGPDAGPPATTVSTSVFHSPQPGHWPDQVSASCPHCWQTCFVLVFAIGVDSRSGCRRKLAPGQVRGVGLRRREARTARVGGLWTFSGPIDPTNVQNSQRMVVGAAASNGLRHWRPAGLTGRCP